MQLEILPNEVLLYLFEFFDVIHLLRSFFGLNLRLNQLIYLHLRIHQVNFQSLSKNDFNLICQRHLPLLLDQIVSLRLSNEETPDLFHLLFYHGFTLNRFIRLQSLSLHYIHSLDLLIKIIIQCQYLPFLTYLNLIECHFDMKNKRIMDLFNNIWRLPKLTHCDLNGLESVSTIALSQLAVVSSTIKELSIENLSCTLNCLSYISKCTPELQRLSAKIDSRGTNDILNLIIPSLKSLKIFFRGSVNSLKSIFLSLPNLTDLTIETLNVPLNGDEWKQIIGDYCPQIKIFHLKMNLEYSENYHHLDKNMDELLNTFQTSFWIKDHQWYVRCDWESSEKPTLATLYTLPYVFKTIYYSNYCQSKSTWIDDDEKYRIYKSVEIFENNHLVSLIMHRFNLICTQFPNLRHLDIVLPLDDNCYLHDVTLNHLTSLVVRIQIASAYSQLQTICDRAPNLYSLRIVFWQKFTSQLMQLTSKSIRRLSLSEMFDLCNDFTREECLAFSDCALGCQCEVLSIDIEDRMSIIDLIERMPNLRLLDIQCRDDKWDYRKRPFIEYELVLWIQKRLPSTYTIMRNPEKLSCIQIWIDQQDIRLTNHSSRSKDERKISQLFSSIQKFFSKK